MNFGVRFLMKFGCENGAKMELEAPAEARTLDLLGRGETFMGSGLFDQDPKNH